MRALVVEGGGRWVGHLSLVGRGAFEFAPTFGEPWEGVGVC